MSRKNSTYTASIPSRPAAVLLRTAPSSSSSLTAGMSGHSLVDHHSPPHASDAYQDSNGRTPGTDGASGGSKVHAGDPNSGSSGQDDEDEGDPDDPPAEPIPASVDAQNNLAGTKITHSNKNKRPLDQADGRDALNGLSALDAAAADEIDFPRKKAREVSPQTTLTDWSEDMAYDEENGTESEEEAAIRREFEFEETKSSNVIDIDYLFNTNASLEDLDSEVFESQWNNAHLYNDMPGGANDPFRMDMGDDLLPVDPSPVTLEECDPVFEEAPNNTSTSDEDEETSDESVFELDALFEKVTPSTKRIVSAYQHEEPSDSDDDVQYFFSSDSSEEEVAANTEIDTGFEEEDDSDDDDDDDDETDDGESTEEEPNLPMPTPISMSKLRRVSTSSIGRPQIVRLNADEDDAPPTAPWIADPNRPICVIEGSKKTFLIPKRDSIGGESGYSSNKFFPMYDSESEKSTAAPPFDPTLGGLLNYGGGALNGSDVVGPPEAFYPYMSAGDETAVGFSDDEEYGEEDIFDVDEGEANLFDVDEGETNLKINDFFELPSDEERRNSGDATTDAETSEDSLMRFDKVNVVAFRARQDQHARWLSTSNAGYQAQNKTKGMLADTITPPKQRRVRKRFLKNNNIAG